MRQGDTRGSGAGARYEAAGGERRQQQAGGVDGGYDHGKTVVGSTEGVAVG